MTAFNNNPPFQPFISPLPSSTFAQHTSLVVEVLLTGFVLGLSHRDACLFPTRHGLLISACPEMSLSAHLVETYERKPIIHPYNPPHPQRPLRPAYFVTSTPFTDRRNMNTDPFWYPVHGGGPGSGPSHVPSSATTASGFSRWSEEKIAALQVRLTKRLGPEYVTQRPGPGGGPKLR